ncbi:ATG2 [Candida margitis]|uniref:ATG2 n=1 Tax=Candida margitis TaxID=1775924 RepID=UPI002227C8BF|nr:ATG2 [Candida margitis]KAI5968854.1 ATG2 [Candida margitis]
MSPQWIPQNIQKRLLLYVLNQLSLFSEVDLPNLEEVSLNNITLKDVSIDPEKVGKLPGFNLRHGKVGAIELTTISGISAVKIDVKNAEVVVSPDYDDVENTASHSQFLLAQTTADLANTIMLETDNYEMQKSESAVGSDSDSDAECVTPIAPTTRRRSSTVSNNSTLGNVMQRAMEMALSRLQINITNLTVKLITESTDLLMEVEEVMINTVNGTRNIKVNGVSIRTLRPDVPDGKKDIPTKTDTTEKSEDEENDDSSDYGEEALMNSMVFTHEEASSIYMSATSQSLGKSTAAEGPVDNKQNIGTTKEPPILFHMDQCDIEFDGLKAISNLEVKVNKVKLTTSPTTATLISIFDGITRTLKIKLYQMKRKSSSKMQKNSVKFPQYSNDDDDDEVDSESSEETTQNEPLFNSFRISSLQIGLNAAIKSDGSFAKVNGLVINLDNIIAKQKNELLLFGGVEVVEILRFWEGNESKVFNFEKPHDAGPQRSVSPSSISSETSYNSETTRADFRFEVFQNEDDKSNLETTLLFAKAAFLNLDEHDLGSLLKVADGISAVSARYSKLKSVLNSIHKLRDASNSSPPNVNERKEHIIVQTASINVTVAIERNLKLQIGILPISFDSIKSELNIASITGHGIVGNQPIGTLFNVTGVNVYQKARDFRAFIHPNAANSNGTNLPRASNLSTLLTVSISEIEYGSTLSYLKLFVKESQHLINSLLEQLAHGDVATSSKSVKHVKLDQPSHMLSSTSNLDRNRRMGLGLNRSPIMSQSTYRMNQVSYCIHIGRISIKVDDILPKFGGLKTDISEITLFKLKNDILGSILALKTVRTKDDFIEDVLYQYQGLEAASIGVPLVTFKYKSMERASTLEIGAHDFLLEYYTYWLTLFGKDESIIEQVEEELIDTAPPKKSSSTHRFDVRLTLYNCLVGLTPGRLRSKSYLTVSKGNVDFVFGSNQSHIKSSIRDIAILLIDDLKNVTPANDSKIDQSNEVIAAEVLSNRGYIQIGSINLAHIGLTFNTNIEEIRRRNHELEIREGLSIIEFKINTDEIQLDLCADSANTFAQLISDLKLPYDFEDEDKMKLRVDADMNILNGIDSNMFKNVSESFAEMDINEEPVSVEASLESSSGLEFQDEHFDYVSSYKSDTEAIDPLKLNINLSRVEIYLYDGYDWKDTRKAIRGAVKKIESVQKKSEASFNETSERNGSEETVNTDTAAEPDSTSVIQETLYQSIYVSAPKAAQGTDLAKSINLGLQNNEDDINDREDKIDANIKRGKNYKNLKLRRSAYHKVVADLRSIDIGVVVYSTRDPRRDNTDPDMKVELLNLVELSLGTIDVYDNVPSSTWNKFLSYMNILGEREVGTSMAKVSILNVRPKPNLVTAEAIMKVSVLPLRLHVDQDTLDFMTRFTDFKDSRFDLPPDEILYIQKFEISPIKLKIDYKPKKVDFTGLRSGRTAEFANFFILDGSSITLPRAHLYGMSGIPELSRGLGKAWAPVFQSTQVLGIVSGVSSLRSVVNIGSGFKNLYVVSRKEYQKDGRFWRSLQKGTTSFAKTTGYELVNMGVKIASGTQVLLEQGEEMLGGEGSSSRTNRTTRRGSDDGSDTSVDFTEIKNRGNGGGNVLLSSQILNKQVAEKFGDDLQFNGQKKLYSDFEFEDDGDDNIGIDKELLSKSIFLLPEDEEINIKSLETVDESDENGEAGMTLATASKDITGDDEGNVDADDEKYDIYAIEETDKDELKQKMVSLYSNQPESFQQGLLSAYKSLGKNFKLTGKQLTKLKKELDKQETVPDSIATVLKNSPVILIRPMIGTTEALSRTLMGIGNVIDPKHMVENKDKYRSESSDDGK